MNIQSFSSYRSSFKSRRKTLQQHAQSAVQLLPPPEALGPPARLLLVSCSSPALPPLLRAFAAFLGFRQVKNPKNVQYL